jgi:3-hydroxyacyl-CoA dehydrogenase
MNDLLQRGHMGNKTPQLGGFYRRVKDGKQTRNMVLDPKSGEYREATASPVAPVPFVEQIKRLNHVGKYAEAFRVFAAAEGVEAHLAKRVILGYISYALNRVGETEVVRSARDVDRIMGFGFNWAPPTVLVDLMGVETTTRLLEKNGLPVPAVLKQAAQRPTARLFREPNVNIGRFFAG